MFSYLDKINKQLTQPIILLGLAGLFSLTVVAQEQPKSQLKDVKQAIKQQKANIKQIDSKRRKLEKQLRIDELAIAKVVKSLKLTEDSIVATKNKLKELQTKQLKLSKEKKKQEVVLAKQIKTAYTTGHHDYLKLLLNQENPASVQRTVTYYQYLNDARIKEIENFKSLISQLQVLQKQQSEKQAELSTLLANQKSQQVDLAKSNIQQKKTIAALNKKRLTNKQKLEKLESEESSLVAELARLAELSRQSPTLDGLAKLKRKLSWPVKGKLLRSFGSRKQGYLKWKGVLIQAGLGKSVKAIHSGKVLFSDWLKGYGLVTVVDHGKGYMSLYGHNQALLKSVGDIVEQGEAIALIGQSGGRSQPGLYFEVRYNGKAVNPKQWCR